MTRSPLTLLALAGALGAALLVSGCGRKGPLDPPPGGWALEGPRSTPVSGSQAPQAFDEQGRPIAPEGPKRSTPADFLLD